MNYERIIFLINIVKSKFKMQQSLKLQAEKFKFIN